MATQSKSHPSRHWFKERIASGLFYGLAAVFLVVFVGNLYAVGWLASVTWLQQPLPLALTLAVLTFGVVHHYFHIEQIILDYMPRQRHGMWLSLWKGVCLLVWLAGLYALYGISG